MTFIAISTVIVNPKVADKYEEAFKNRSKIVDSFEGFIGLNFLRSQKKIICLSEYLILKIKNLLYHI